MVIKTVSGSDLMELVARGLGREVVEKPVGFKYIAAEMLKGEVLIGGEESGGVGVGVHLPERDACWWPCSWWRPWWRAALPLGERLDRLRAAHGGGSAYDRLDSASRTWPAANGWSASSLRRRRRLWLECPCLEASNTDGLKLRLGPSHWLMLRFSGTEPLLRLYCEAPSQERVAAVLAWAQQFAEAVGAGS